MGGVLPPLKSPNSRNRVGPLRPCAQCGRDFRPWRHSQLGLFCSSPCFFAFERKRKADELAVRQADPDFLPSIHREMEAALAKLAEVVIPSLDDAEVMK